MKLQNTLSLVLILVAMVLATTSCEKEMIERTVPNPEQLLAGRLTGTWVNPVNIITPTDVPPEVFGNMRLVFTTDDAGNPAAFLGKDCPIVFSAAESSWVVTGTQELTTVKLSGTAPVDEFQAQVDANNLTLSFYMGWENIETGETGEGDFQVTLTRQ
ncbi:hypothetical protein [Sphingobacterium sp. SGR-19]|uniref:hypothetical protein n=1 Tax=Sphingobacterium sp. SGR-19 TaxID=2710886 RepID=UPI0013EA49A6|nr:hypothetical protein [Sphingobacterium sp. SGR-19]NGM64109.1 hypothetical protein [Sphingobacterium sp. SGR-19]